MLYIDIKRSRKYPQKIISIPSECRAIINSPFFNPVKYLLHANSII